MREIDLHPHVPEEMAHLFTAKNAGTVEDEYGELLYSLIRAAKPETVLETGSYHGETSVVICSALRKNGFGKLITIELVHEYANEARVNLANAGHTEYELVEAFSCDYLNSANVLFDFAFYDSLLELRAKEFEICLQRGLFRKGAFAVFHDTSKLRTIQPNQPDPVTSLFCVRLQMVIAEFGISEIVEFPLSKGMILLHI